MSKRRGKGVAPWRKHQGDDRYFQQAKAEGYRARSAYKLLQIQERFDILHKGEVVVDLGAAPGSWSQVAAGIVGSTGRVIAVDLQPIEPIPGVMTLQGDITAPDVQERIAEAAGDLVDVVLSDAAPNTSGVRERDHALAVALVEAAFDVVQRVLKPGGSFVAKVFEGEDVPQLLARLRQHFVMVKPHCPRATRRESREVFLVCKGFKGK